MNLKSIELNRGAIDIVKVLLLLLLLETMLLLVVSSGNKLYIAGFAAILTVPVFLVLLPVHPTLGILAMIFATGMDFLGVIAETRLPMKFDFTYFHVALLVTFIATFLNMILKRSLYFPSLELWAPLLLFNLSVGLSLIYTPNFIVGSWMFVRILAMGLLTWMVVQIVNRKWQVSAIMWVMILVPFGVSILSIYQLFTQGSFYSEIVYRTASALGMQIYRATGTFANPNYLGCFLMVGVIVPFGLMFHRKYPITLRMVLVGAAFVTTAGLITTFSRTGWLSTLIAVLVVIALHKKWSYFGVMFGLGLAAIVFLAFEHPEILEAILYRFTTIFTPSEDDSSSSRLSLIRTGIWMWQDHPIFGIGIEGFSKLYDLYVDPNMPDILVNVKYPHTIQSQILTELGLVGFIIATWLYFTILFKGIRTSFSLKNDLLRNAQIILTSLHVGFMVNFTFANDLVNNIFWINVGLIYALPLIEKHSLLINEADSGAGEFDAIPESPS